MIESTQVVRYGRQASEALALTIAAAQVDDALAPVTVVVSSNFVGLSMRRLVATGRVVAGRGPGLANVSFVTPFQLAELVAADLLLDSRPITNPVLGAAVRQVLRNSPGPYARVAEHEATEAALAALFAELSNVDEAGLEAMLDEGSTAAVLAVEFHRAIAAQLDGFHTENDLVTAAAQRPDLRERLERFGTLVWYLPEPTTQPVGRFLHRALGDAPSVAIVGVSGSAEADAGVWRTAELVGVRQPKEPHGVGCAVADRVVSVTDPVEEVRETCSRILQLLADEVPADRIGVFFPTPDPYVRIIEQQFTAAGIPINGPDPRRLVDSVAGRTLLGALDLPAGRWRRDRVMAVVSGAPVRVDDERARPSAWDKISRAANVVGDLSDWVDKLTWYRSREQERGERLRDIGNDPAADQVAGDIEDLDRLHRFVESTAEGVSLVTAAESWANKCASAQALLVQLLGPEHRHSAWPVAEQEAFARVDEALDRLAALDDIEPTPRHAVFLRALRNELDVARSRHGRFGHGVMFGSLVSAAGHDVDAVFVLGAAEGTLPTPRRDDAVLPDSVRLASLDQLEPKRDRLHHQHRALLAALDAAPPGGRTLMFPRGSLRSSRRSLPSRWLLDTVSALSGDVVHVTDFDALGDDVVETVGSYASALDGPGPATSTEERDAASIDLGTADATSHPLARLVRRGLEMQAARSSPRFTEFDGNLAGVSVGLGSRALSPSRLEAWASCGFRYLMQYVLGASDRDDPERIEELSAMDRGSLLHETLEEFIQQALDDGPPEPAAPWSESDIHRLHEIAERVAHEYERSGRTGRPVHWRVQRDDLHDLLDAFIEVDNRFRAAHGVTPNRVELDFGVRDGTPVEIDLPDGRTVKMRGVADRIDMSADGRRTVVSDYKSGKGAKFKQLGEDPFTAGTTLQLGMYAEGALRETGASSARADYWMIEGGETRHGYEWSDELRSRFREVLAAIVDGIEGGVFAASPGDWNTYRQTNENCTWCDFDGLCQRNRGEQAEAKAGAPELAVRERLLPLADADPDVAGGTR